MEKQNKAVAGSGNAPSIKYDYANQAWIVDGKIDKCGHREKQHGCFSCHHAGEIVGTQQPWPKFGEDWR